MGARHGEVGEQCSTGGTSKGRGPETAHSRQKASVPGVAGGPGGRERQGQMGGASKALIFTSQGSHRELEAEVDELPVTRLFWLLGVLPGVGPGS